MKKFDSVARHGFLDTYLHSYTSFYVSFPRHLRTYVKKQVVFDLAKESITKQVKARTTLINESIRKRKANEKI